MGIAIFFLCGVIIFNSMTLPYEVPCQNITISSYNKISCIYNPIDHCTYINNCIDVKCDDITNPSINQCCITDTLLCSCWCQNITYNDIKVEISDNRTASFVKQGILSDILPITCWLDGNNLIQINYDNNSIVTARQVSIYGLIIFGFIGLTVVVFIFKGYHRHQYTPLNDI